MTILGASDVVVDFGADTVLNKISFSINEGDKLGIVGVNGAGKSTLLRVMAGTLEPTEGSVFISKGRSVCFLEQNAMLESDKTVFEEMLTAFADAVEVEKQIEELSKTLNNTNPKDDLYNGVISKYSYLTERFKNIGGYEYKSRIRSTLARFGFGGDAENKRISTLSGGERTRLALVKSLLSAPDILMLDEPTNHLDAETLEWLEEHLGSYPKTVIVVSHDRFFLDRVATKILDIERTEAKLYVGNYSSFAAQKAEARKALLRKYEQQQKEIARIEEIIATQRRFGQERNFITAASKQKQIEHMEKIDAPSAPPKSIKMKFGTADESGNEVVAAERIEKSFGSKKVLDNVSFLVRKGDRITVIGPNGCGKSTLIKIIDGKLMPDRGVCEFGVNVAVGYYDQEQKTLGEENTVIEELCLAHPKLTNTEIRGALANFLFFSEDIQKPISSLSGGERARLMLCKMILSRVNLLILDEPTNHLDINSREALEGALLGFDGTIIAVSHDRYFMEKISTRVFDLTNGFYDFHGGYDEYLAHKAARTQKEKPDGENGKSMSIEKFKYINNKKLASDIRRAEARLAKDEREIERLEAEKAALQNEAENSAATNYIRLSEISAEVFGIEKRLEELYSDYESAEDELTKLKYTNSNI